MRHVIITMLSFVMSFGAAFAKDAKELAPVRTFGYTNSVIFEEQGVTFSVYPDGEFDFFIDNPTYLGAAYHNNGVSISFNAGFNYSPWVQYDDYGAVIQIENTPVYYDFYGRVNRIGGVNIYYNGGRVSRVGGLYVYYNGFGRFNRFRGYVNVYNRHFVYRPVYNYFARPAVGLCLVNTRPYRRYYHPVRYTYYRPYRNNYRRAYANIGRTYHYKESNPRRTVYRNDRRVSRRNDAVVRNQIRNRSVQYTNARGYNKNESYRGGKRKSVAVNNRGYSKPTNVKRAAKTPGNRGYSKANNTRRKPVVARSNKRNTRANSAGRSVTTKRSTTVRTPGKTVRKTTSVTRNSRAKVNTRSGNRAKKNNSYGSTRSKRSVSKPYSNRSNAKSSTSRRSNRASAGRNRS